MESENSSGFSDLVDSDIELIRTTCKIDIVDCKFSGSVCAVYGYLKQHLQNALGIDKNFDFENKESLENLRKKFTEVYALSVEGAMEMPFSNLSDFPLAFLIEYGMYRKNKCPYDDVEKISEYYYLLALRDLAKFEAGINDSVPNALSREYLQNELACTKYLLDSLYSAFISERDIGKERSIRARVAFEILEDGLPGIRAHEARDESNARISLAARKKWLPLILDVHKRLQKIPKPTKSDACRFAVKGKAEKWKSLRNAYNTWAKDPEKYEEGLN